MNHLMGQSWVKLDVHRQETIDGNAKSALYEGYDSTVYPRRLHWAVSSSCTLEALPFACVVAQIAGMCQVVPASVSGTKLSTRAMKILQEHLINSRHYCKIASRSLAVYIFPRTANTIPACNL